MLGMDLSPQFHAFMAAETLAFSGRAQIPRVVDLPGLGLEASSFVWVSPKAGSCLSVPVCSNRDFQLNQKGSLEHPHLCLRFDSASQVLWPLFEPAAGSFWKRFDRTWFRLRGTRTFAPCTALLHPKAPFLGGG